MITVNDIERALFDWAPLSFAVKDDPVGLQVGERSKPVRHVLVSLDVTQAVLNEAVFSHADVIVSHHRIWRDGIQPTDDSDAGALLYNICLSGLASIAMHTNLDAAEGGVNDVLANVLGLTDVRVFDKKDGIGRLGLLDPTMSVRAFALHCKSAVNTCVVRYFDAGKPVHNVALCSGGGDSLLDDAINAGCDTFVTADVKHHKFLVAQNQGVNLLDCGHFATENVIVPVIADYLMKTFPDLKVTMSRETKEPFECL